jgi:transposase
LKRWRPTSATKSYWSGSERSTWRKTSGKVCVRIPGKSHRITRVWDVGATTGAIMALADELVELRIERVVLEATSDYWRPHFYILEARELCVWLVNARELKNVPGRPKTDKLDAIWLAKLNERGMLRPSFVPPKEIRELRDYTRLRAELVEGRSRYKDRLEKLLEDGLIKLSVVATGTSASQAGRCAALGHQVTLSPAA